MQREANVTVFGARITAPARTHGTPEKPHTPPICSARHSGRVRKGALIGALQSGFASPWAGQGVTSHGMSRKAQAMMFRALAVSLVWMLLPAMAQGQGILDAIAQSALDELAESDRQRCEDGDALACWSLGFSYLHGAGAPVDKPRAAALFRRACEGGRASGCSEAGFMYYEGNGVAQDFARSTSFYQQACQLGSMGDCYIVGLHLAEGIGIPQNYVSANTFFRQACEGEDFQACTDLGRSYFSGQGVSQDYGRAVALFRQACRGNEMRGCIALGATYGNGYGVPQDYVRSHALMNIAAAQGNDTARSGRDSVASLMTPQQIAEAQALARRCMEEGMEPCL